MPSINLLVKPASSLCTMRCRYCFYLDEAKNRQQESFGIMTTDTLENVIEKALLFASGSCTIAYQGGEPTLAGIEFFKKSVEFQNKYNVKKVKINNAIQTNALEINSEWAKFFANNNFLVGVSLDGTKECHDAFRTDAKGKSTFMRVMAGIELLKLHGAKFNILTVVNSVTAKKIQSVYSFFKKNNFAYLQFIPCLQPFGMEGERLPFTLSPRDFGSFLCNLFDLWYRDFMEGNAPHIRQFENLVEMLLGYPPESCGMSGICSFQNVIEADGSCYPCDFYVLDGYALGNLNEVDFESTEKKRRELKFVENSAQINDKCLSCKHFKLCRGGCKRYCEPFTDSGRNLNLLCECYYDFFEHSAQRLTGIARAMGRR